MKKLSCGLKKIFSPDMSHHGSGSHSQRDGMPLGSRWFSSSTPPLHEAELSSHHPMHTGMPPIDDDDISIRIYEELAMFESFHSLRVCSHSCL
jgi:hypothetical protein